MLIFFLRGTLPWQSLRMRGLLPLERERKIGMCKEKMSPDDLCRNYPGQSSVDLHTEWAECSENFRASVLRCFYKNLRL